jgi:hypothetical protein
MRGFWTTNSPLESRSFLGTQVPHSYSQLQRSVVQALDLIDSKLLIKLFRACDHLVGKLICPQYVLWCRHESLPEGRVVSRYLGSPERSWFIRISERFLKNNNPLAQSLVDREYPMSVLLVRCVHLGCLKLGLRRIPAIADPNRIATQAIDFTFHPVLQCPHSVKFVLQLLDGKVNRVRGSQTLHTQCF